jgi:hypothetical protein
LPSRFSPASRARLTRHDVGRFSGATLFDRVGRAICEAGCLPRKELFEAWAVAKRVRRLFHGGRIADLGAGHGLLAQLMLLLDESSASAVVVDTEIPLSAEKVHQSLVSAWPRLAGRVEFLRQSMDAVPILPDDIVVSSHACGTLTDVVIDRALSARARVAVLPCCHDLDACDAGDLDGWMDGALAVDVMRANRLRDERYRVWTLAIPAEITPKNRLLLGMPADQAAAKSM